MKCDIMEEIERVRTPREGEVLGIVEATLGANKFNVRCQDEKMRICRVPGRFKKRMWIKVGDIVLVEPWEIQGDIRGDIIWRYTNTQADWLRRRGILKM